MQAGGKHDLMKKLFNPGKDGKRFFDFLLPTSFFRDAFSCPVTQKVQKSLWGAARRKKADSVEGVSPSGKSGRAPSSPGASKNRRTFVEGFAFARKKNDTATLCHDLQRVTLNLALNVVRGSKLRDPHTLYREENCNSPRRPRCSDSPTQGTHLRCRFPTTPISDAFPSNPAECMAFFKRRREPERRGSGGGRIYISTPKFNRARVETPPTHPAALANSLLFLMMLLWLLYMAVQIGKQWQTVCQKL